VSRSGMVRCTIDLHGSLISRRVFAASTSAGEPRAHDDRVYLLHSRCGRCYDGQQLPFHHLCGFQRVGSPSPAPWSLLLCTGQRASSAGDGLWASREQVPGTELQPQSPASFRWCSVGGRRASALVCRAWQHAPQIHSRKWLRCSRACTVRLSRRTTLLPIVGLFPTTLNHRRELQTCPRMAALSSWMAGRWPARRIPHICKGQLGRYRIKTAVYPRRGENSRIPGRPARSYCQ
jgi:hypothetical protein